MVPIEEIIPLRDRLLSNPRIDQFDQFIKGQIFVKQIGEANSDTDKSYLEFLHAITVNDRNAFSTAYAEFSRKKPSVDSPWVNNDYFIFAIILGVEHFFLDNTWIQEVLNLRKSGNQEQQLLTTTFRNILTGNILSNENLHSVVIVFLDFLKKPQLERTMLDSTYKSLTESNLLKSKNDFLVITALRAYNLIILSKDTIDSKEFLRLKKFDKSFLQRTENLNDILFGILVISLLLYGVKLIREYNNFRNFMTDIGAIIQVIGFTLLSGLLMYLRKRLLTLMRFGLGYTKE